MTFSIETTELRKVYGEKVAVRGLTLQVREGEAFGFLGPNGAGKTTSLKMLLGLAKPTSGRAFLFGSPMGDPSLRSKVGFLPEHFRFHEWLTGREFLNLHGNLYGIQSAPLQKRIGELLALVGLSDFVQKQLRTYSKGMLQRIGLAQALINDPRIVFLDEPTSGLDPAGRRLVRDIIHQLRDKGTTIFLNSHLLSEVEITCDRVAFIKHGEVLRVDELKKLSSGQTTVSIRASGIKDEMMQGLKRWSEETTLNHNKITLRIADETLLPEITRYLVQQNVQIYSVIPERIDLEELFLRIVGKDAGL
ncbi:ABC transporter ATP-binding protein [bacterium]|nr:ABC transporter ATP-binding protein [bacterium]MCI0604494.1 ABC transporter ATP-binding protein [bacterium]